MSKYITTAVKMHFDSCRTIFSIKSKYLNTG